jgi:hypothetical protein
MITATLQMAVFVICAVGFAWLVLRIDKRDSGRKSEEQRSFYFPEHKEDDREQRGAAMSRL